MNRRILVALSLLTIASAFSYLVFIQKPFLPDYFRSLAGGKGSPFAQISNIKKTTTLKVPILTYHYVEDVTDERDTLRQSMATRPFFFEEQLKYLKNNDYVAVSLSELRQALEGKIRLPEKSVILTFDDGYKDFYTDALPLLKKYQMKAINYIIVNHLGRSGNLSEQMVVEMLQSGLMEIGCHTLNHEYLPRLKLEAAKKEIEECKSQLEARFGVKVNHFAYPGGYYNQTVVNLVREAGFETAVGTVPGVLHNFDNIYTLKRLRVGNLDAVSFGKHLEGPKEE